MPTQIVFGGRATKANGKRLFVFLGEKSKTLILAGICMIVNNESARGPKANWVSWMVGILMAIIIALSIISGIFDYFLSAHVKGTGIEHKLGYKIFLAFSLVSSVQGILSTKGVNKPGQIGPLHCMRFFSMVWIITGHTMENLLTLATNLVDVLDISKKTPFYILSNAFFSVDTFFFIGGVLLSYIWFKELKRNRRAVMSPQGWILFYAHRILRLSPAYYFAIFFYSFIYLPSLPDTAFRLNFAGGTEDACRKYCWPSMLYLQNIVHYQHQCYGITWYLAADMQMFVFTPIFLIAMAFSKVVGLAVAGTVLLLSTGGNAATIYRYHYPEIPQIFDVQDPKETNADSYMLLMYHGPWFRCQIYVIGLLVGYLLQTKKTFKINKGLNAGLLLLSMALMLFDILILHANPQDKLMPIFWRAVYSCLSKPLWGLCLSYIVISCYFGHGGIINSFMSWPGWTPLGRLTYSAYLIHWMVLYYLLTIHPAEIIWANNFFDVFCNFALPAIVITYLLAIFWSSWFEVAVGKVESLLIGGYRRPEIRKIEESDQNGYEIPIPKDVEASKGARNDHVIDVKISTATKDVANNWT